MVGSTVPSSLTRRSTIWIDCSTDWRMRSTMAGSVTAFDDGRLGDGKADQAAAGINHLDAALARGAEDAPKRLGQFAQLAQRLRAVHALAETNLDGIAADGGRGQRPPVVADHAADVLAQCLHLFLAHRVGVDLEQDVRAALQIEAQHDMALRPFRPGTQRGLGEKIRKCGEAHNERREQNRRRSPPRNVQHAPGPPADRPINSTCPPLLLARPWSAHRPPSSESGERGCRLQSRPRSARRRPLW